MQTKNRYIEKSSNQKWFDWCRSLLSLYNTDKYFFYHGIEKGSALQMRQWILAHRFEGVQRILRNLLLDAMISADNRNTGSEIYVPWFLYNETEAITERHSSETYLKATLSKTHDDLAKEIFTQVYNNVGPLTKIIVKPSYEREVVVKYRNAFSFPLALDPQFHRIIGHAELIEQTNPIVIMIEGAPETAAEINSLLQWNNTTGRPVLLIARSFPEEVSATLATNWLRGSLSILPIPYGNTIETINLAADICSITKGELISAHFGDIITASVLNEDKWGEVDRIEWSNGNLQLYKNANVDGHIRNIINKLKTIEEEEIQKIYRERILSLSNDAVELWIPKSNTHTLAELDSLIKHYNGFVTSGMVNTPIGMIPKCFFDSAKEVALSLRKEILNIGGFLVGVDNEVVAG